jgi:hypothetical protein
VPLPVDVDGDGDEDVEQILFPTNSNDHLKDVPEYTHYDLRYASLIAYIL